MPDQSLKLEQARQLLAEGRTNQAKAALQRVLRSAPLDVEANALMRAMLVTAGQYDAALAFARRAHDGAPDDAHNALELGRLLTHLGRAEEGERLLAAAAERLPGDANAWGGLAAAQLSQQKLAAGLETVREARRRFPEDQQIGQQLAAVLLELGRADEAAGVFAGMLLTHAADPGFVCNYATVLNYAAGVEAARVETAHRNAGRLVGLTRVGSRRGAARVDAGKRPLRLGVLSADLYSHSVAYFLEPLLEHLDRARFEVVCYAAGRVEDQTTARLKRHAKVWRAVARLNDEGLSRQIAADGVDVLIETSGLTAGHRLGALLDRPAPVQLTWCGYPNITGCTFIDGRVVDAVTDPLPAGGGEASAAERLLRVDGCFLCYRPEEAAPAVGPLPAGQSGVVTFGSFNNFAKVNKGLVRLWARVLEASPRSRLMLKNAALAEAGTREFIAGWFAELGIARERLELVEPTRGKAEHLGAYGRVDIALDTFPYHGTTTTCEALWMGVPVVTLTGDRHASRVGASLLKAAGMPELAASSEDEYVRIAASLAGDPGALARMRAGLREKVGASRLCDAKGFAARFADVVEGAWRAAAAGG